LVVGHWKIPGGGGRKAAFGLKNNMLSRREELLYGGFDGGRVVVWGGKSPTKPWYVGKLGCGGGGAEGWPYHRVWYIEFNACVGGFCEKVGAGWKYTEEFKGWSKLVKKRGVGTVLCPW